MTALHRRFVCDLKVIGSLAQDSMNTASNVIQNLPLFQNMQAELKKLAEQIERADARKGAVVHHHEDPEDEAEQGIGKPQQAK